MGTPPSPPDDDFIIWRYMDIEKFCDFLGVYNEKHLWTNGPSIPNSYQPPGQIWFSHPFAFEDDHEATFAMLNRTPEEFCDRMASLLELGPEEAAEKKERFLRLDTQALCDAICNLAELCGVSCWTHSEDEDLALWTALFNQSPDAVAVRTTVGHLEQAIVNAYTNPRTDAAVKFTKVGYIDHGSDFMEHDGYWALLCFVDEQWNYENEVRVLAKSYHFKSMNFESDQPLSDDEKQQHWTDTASKSGDIVARLQSENREGFHLPLDLPSLEMEVVLSPYAGDKEFKEVQRLLESAHLSPDIARPSRIRQP